MNEKLHNLYISSVFGNEKKEMERENLDVKLKLPSMKVRDVLFLMNNGDSKGGKLLGIFQITDEKSKTNMKNETNEVRTRELYNVILKDREKSAGKIFQKVKNSKKFIISHSAKDV